MCFIFSRIALIRLKWLSKNQIKDVIQNALAVLSEEFLCELGIHDETYPVATDDSGLANLAILFVPIRRVETLCNHLQSVVSNCVEFYEQDEYFLDQAEKLLCQLKSYGIPNCEYCHNFCGNMSIENLQHPHCIYRTLTVQFCAYRTCPL